MRTTAFSRFFRKATPEEKQAVYRAVIDEANKEQQKLMKSLDVLEHNVVQWAELKGIFENSDPFKQLNKMQEEVDELYEAVMHTDKDSVINELGDVIVTCCVQAAMWDVSLQECLQVAYDKISKRTGVMRNGMFVRDMGS